MSSRLEICGDLLESLGLVRDAKGHGNWEPKERRRVAAACRCFRFGSPFICDSCIRPQVWPSLFSLSRSMAFAEQLRDDFQRQRISIGQWARRADLPTAGLLAHYISRDTTVAPGEQRS